MIIWLLMPVAECLAASLVVALMALPVVIADLLGEGYGG